MKKMNAFTLSEVLIALLVLGIIIAASVPSIMRLSPNKNAAMMKKAYYTTETIVNELINDSNYYPEYNSDGNETSGFDNADQKRVVGTTIDTTTNRKFKCLFASKLNIKENLENVCNAGGIDIVTTMDGMTWHLGGLRDSYSASYPVSHVEIDVDGKSNGVSVYNGDSNLGACPNADTWYTNCTDTWTDEIYKKKKFDRISITITPSGQIKIEHDQQALIEILSGQTKVIGGEND